MKNAKSKINSYRLFLGRIDPEEIIQRFVDPALTSLITVYDQNLNSYVCI